MIRNQKDLYILNNNQEEGAIPLKFQYKLLLVVETTSGSGKSHNCLLSKRLQITTTIPFQQKTHVIYRNGFIFNLFSYYTFCSIKPSNFIDHITDQLLSIRHLLLYEAYVDSSHAQLPGLSHVSTRTSDVAIRVSGADRVTIEFTGNVTQVLQHVNQQLFCYQN